MLPEKVLFNLKNLEIKRGV